MAMRDNIVVQPCQCGMLAPLNRAGSFSQIGGEAMQTIMPPAFRNGMVLMLEGTPFMIEECHPTGTAKTKHKMHARMRNLRNGRVAERTFQENEQITAVQLEQRGVQFSYRQGDECVFLDLQSFDEVKLTAEQIGERHWFLRENDEHKALFLERKLLDIQLPDHVSLKVQQTAAPQRAAQASTLKPATLEGGLEVMVPLFIATGEVVRVDTRHRKYLGKESGA
jgi:elongation factor P